MELNEQQISALALRAYRWIQTIERLNDFSEPAPAGRGDRTSLPDDVHLLMLSLQHLSNCLSHLIGNTVSTRFDGLASEFIAAWDERAPSVG